MNAVKRRVVVRGVQCVYGATLPPLELSDFKNMISQQLLNQSQDLVIKTKKEYDTFKDFSVEMITFDPVKQLFELTELNHRIAFNYFLRVKEMDENDWEAVDSNFETQREEIDEEITNDALLNK